ncbi:MAG: hypothetical protein A2042_09335 [Candidatus Schekmanbacteria bacterium GWA2_38_11]|uniref:Uncharacterized protein n=1 Tax=Candidatus Schekmanbacteria bacterium GWA2_38_11 TaxID=1817876 RepID=A0A1F7RE77_9BACT|nr:MAG: hypothetical protein A2042_09335 [Candidatus Schekmanbacteria bacterium GWA2_38_11]
MRPMICDQGQTLCLPCLIWANTKFAPTKYMLNISNLHIEKFKANAALEAEQNCIFQVMKKLEG